MMPVTFSVGKLTDIFISYYTNCKYVLVYFILILFWIMIVIKPANNLFNILSRCICLTILLFSCSVMSYSLRPHGLQHTSVPCYSLSPEVWSNFCLLNQWCHPTISSSVVHLSFCLQSFPAPGSLPMNQFFAQWPKYWSFRFSISLSNEYSGLISFRIDPGLPWWLRR